MAFEKEIPQWGAAGVEPPASLKAAGFTSGYKPPAPYFNWFWSGVSACLKELQDKAVPTVKKDNTDLNTMVDTGLFGYALSCTNKPTNKSGFILVHRHATDYIVQVAVVHGENTIYTRYSNDSGAKWTDWYKNYSTASKPTAAEVDAHGLSERGALIPASSNLDDFKTPGDYFVSGANDAATITNTPTTGSGYRLIVEAGYVPGYIRQYAIGVSGNIQTRYYQSSWSKWVKIVNTEDMEKNIHYHATANLTAEDLNTVLTPGFYYGAGGNTCKNSPAAAGSAFGLEVVQSAGGYYTQICYVADLVSIRYYNGSTWQAWRTVCTTSGGKLTGPLVLTEGVHYGDTLPSDATKGRVFFKKVSS